MFREMLAKTDFEILSQDFLYTVHVQDDYSHFVKYLVNPLNTAEISKISTCFKGYFGGKSGTLEILEKYQMIPETKNPKITLQQYNTF